MLIRIGDWVTQYSAGYWQVVDLKPKYDEYGRRDQGTWVLLKKGFTPKMKFRIDCEFVDAQWCAPVSDDVLSQIESFFSENPDKYEKFISTPFKPHPSVTAIWLEPVDEAELQRMEQCLKMLPETFTYGEFEKFARKNGISDHFVKPGVQGRHILYLNSYLYEVSVKHEMLYRDPEIKMM